MLSRNCSLDKISWTSHMVPKEEIIGFENALDVLLFSVFTIM